MFIRGETVFPLLKSNLEQNWLYTVAARSHAGNLPNCMLMKLNKTVFALLACTCTITLFTGCASVLCGPKQSFSIGSKPDGADVYIYDAHGEKLFENKTPCSTTLARVKPDSDRASYVVVIKKQGFASVQIPLTSSVNKAYFGNILLGGIGFFIDPATGAMWTLSPTPEGDKVLDHNTAFLRSDSLFVNLNDNTPKGLTADNRSLAK